MSTQYKSAVNAIRRGAAKPHILGLAMLTTLAGPALAQSTSGAKPDRSVNDAAIDEIVVTAQFREQNLQDTPLAITAVNSALLEARGQSDLTDVAAQAPSVNLQTASQFAGPTLIAYIRGIGQIDITPAYDPGVGTYVDDVYLGSLAGSTLKLIDVERIEVLRGPQGTLSGRNSIGGAVKLYSKKPVGGDTGYVSLRAGSYKHLDVQASADLTVVPEKIFLRISGAALHEDGYVDLIDYGCAFPSSGVPSFGGTNAKNCKRGTLGGQQYVGGRVAARFVPTERFEFTILGDYTQHRDDPNAAALREVRATGNAPLLTNPTTGQTFAFSNMFVPTDRYVNYGGFTNPGSLYGAYSVPIGTDLDQWGVSANADLEISDNVLLKSITAYRGFNLVIGEDIDSTPVHVELQQVATSNRQFSQELRLESNLFNDRLALTTGLYYFRQTARQGGRADGGDVGPTFDFLYADKAPSNNKSAFAHGVLAVTDRLNITAGVRYTKEHKEFSFFRTRPDHTLDFTPPFAFSSLNNTVGKFNFSRFDYRGVVDYKINDDVMAYAQISTGFKAGGLNPRPFIPQQAVGVGPEKMTAYEVGLKTTLFDRSLRLNVAAFLSDYKNLQLTQSSCPENLAAGFPATFPGCPLTNGGDAEIKGLEGEAALNLGALRIDASASTLDFQYKNISPRVIGLTKDMVPPYTPKTKASIGAQYEVEIGSAGSLTPRIDVTYQSGYFTGINLVNTPESRVPGRTLANGRLTWRDTEEKWQISVEIENIFDKYYDLSRLYFDRSGVQARFAQPAKPRTMLVGVKRTF